jgi:L-seryl-tRNA(Ser) seleniumtransferase
MLAAKAEDLERRARRLAEALRPHLPADASLEVVSGEAQVGSGSVPVETLASWLLALRPGAASADETARSLRLGRPPVFTRIHEGAVLFDLRTIQPEEDVLVEAAVRRALASKGR